MIDGWRVGSHVLEAAAMLGLAYALQRTRTSATRTGIGNELSVPGVMSIFGYAITVAFVGAAIAAHFFAGPPNRWVPFVFLGLSLLGFAMIGEGRVRHTLGSRGIDYRGLFKRTEVPWTALTSAWYNPGAKWLVLKTKDGRVLRFSMILSGIDTLALALEKHAPQLASKPPTTQMLAEARAGVVPSAFG